MTLADLDEWSPDAIAEVFSAVTDDSAQTRMSSDDLGRIIDAVPWEGEAYDAAKAANTDVRRNLNLHADELEAVGEAVRTAESEIRDIKSDWQKVARMADRWGIAINVDTHELSYQIPDDPEERAEVERRVDIIEEEIVDLLQRADAADNDLAAAINGAAGAITAEELDNAITHDEIDNPFQAERDVHDALGGNQDAATRVNNVLDSISPEQTAGVVPLNDMQAAVLSQLQAQQNGMSVGALGTAEGRLGEQRDMIANSWQLMSNSKLNFPKTELTPGAKHDPNTSTEGGLGQLPAGVQQAVTSSGLLYTEQMNTIADIVHHGNDALQTNTALDQSMMAKASAMMETPLWQKDPASNGDTGLGRDPGIDPVVSNVLSAVSGDRQVVHDTVNSEAGERFLHNVTHHYWADGGQTVGELFSWTDNPAAGQEAIAGKTAWAYASYLGENSDPLLNLPGAQTLGAANPELVRAMAEGLSAYIPDIAGIEGGSPHFDSIDEDEDVLNGTLSNAKGVFAVMSTDPEASAEFNGTASGLAMAGQQQYMNELVDGLPPDPDSTALSESATLRGLMNTGVHTATQAGIDNHQENLVTDYDQRKAAYEYGVKALATGSELIPKVPGVTGPGIELLGATLQDQWLGEAPDPDRYELPPLPELSATQLNWEVLNSVLASGRQVDGIPEALLTPVDPAHPEVPRQIISVTEAMNRHDIGSENYERDIEQAVARLGGYDLADPNLPTDDMVDKYGVVKEVPNPNGR